MQSIGTYSKPQSPSLILSQPLALPCGVTLPNRLVKGAMSEFLADSRNRATEKHATLYRTFARKGPGLLFTGNVQVDRLHLEHGSNVVIQGPQGAKALEALKSWSSAAKAFGGQVWMQLSHSGRQTQKSINAAPKAPSAVKVNLPGDRFVSADRHAEDDEIRPARRGECVGGIFVSEAQRLRTLQHVRRYVGQDDRSRRLHTSSR